MPITYDTFAQHVTYWVRIFKKSSSPYRRHWPPRLFRHEPVENAAVILRDGRLLSRKAAQGSAPRDIADKQIIASQTKAHVYARLYFRPKNPTQYHVEGIRKPIEYYHNDPDTHAPVIVIMVFRSMGILTMPDVHFSDGNMQSPYTDVFSDDNAFRKLPFDKIYHVGPISQGSDIIRCRCAEVLIPGSLNLYGHLQAVLCRSPAERATLLHMLGNEGKKWSSIIRVYTEPGIFENRYAYIDRVDVSGSGITFNTHPRFDMQPIRLRVIIYNQNMRIVRQFTADAAPANQRLKCSVELEPGSYLVVIEVDGCLAYKAVSLVDDLPF